MTTESALDRLFKPVWAGGWIPMRWLWVIAAAWAHFFRFSRIEDAYAASDLRIQSGPWRLSEYVVWSVPTAYFWWFLGAGGIVAVARGGRWLRPGLLAFLIGVWALLGVEAINTKAHDRLMLWLSVMLALSPAWEDNLTEKYRSPVVRWAVMIVFCAIYGSTGIMKAAFEPGWYDGTTLQAHLVHRFHAGGYLASWVSGQRWLTAPMSWWTLLFEIGFPFLVWSRRTNPILLVMGVGFHLGLLAMMTVGPFGIVSMSMYPVMLHPPTGERWWRRLSGRHDDAPAASARAGDAGRDGG